ncbi:MAG: M4 family metallopeptidase [Tumebacillaceae bacterium]
MKKQIASALFLTTLFAAPAIALADNSAVGTNGTITFNTWYKTSTNLYYMEDHTRMANVIATYDYRNSTSTYSSATDADNLWNTTSQRAVVDANYYAAKVYDWWKANLGRDSYDGLGSPMISAVHYSRSYNNAFFDGQKAVYGDGDGVTYLQLASDFDVVAGVWNQAMIDTLPSNLQFSGQPGALKISWTNAFTVSISNANWTIGENSYTPGTPGDAMLSLSNPLAYGQPEHMSQYVTTTADNGGIHTNSGIPNKAFYNFATAIGSRNDAAKIWYIAMKDYMTPTTNFAGARAATLAACAALYGSTSITYSALQNAWTSVGIL